MVRDIPFPDWTKIITDEELDRQIAKAREAGRKANETEPRAKSVHYDEASDLIVIELKNGAFFSFPPRLAQGLGNGTPEQLNDIWLDSVGSSVHWDSLDVDFDIPLLIQGVFGTKAWMAELGRKGGQVSTPAKAKAARENGKKGGRPRKNPPKSSKSAAKKS
jgi:hypothetical protein